MIENDLCYIKAIIIDTGDDKIIARLYMNESKRENILIGSFYLPICENRRVMVGGTGMRCHIKSMTVSNMDLEEVKEEAKIFSYEEDVNLNNMQQDDVIGDIRDPCCCSIF